MASNKLRNLPPDVRRELLRHVKPTASTSQYRQQQRLKGDAEGMSNNKKILIGCGVFVAGAASLPYWATQTIGNLTEKDDPLTAAQVRRGPFLNSGSNDAGPDRNWDWKNGKYVYPPGFAEHLKQNQNPNETDLGPDIGPMVQQEKINAQERMKQKQQDD